MCGDDDGGLVHCYLKEVVPDPTVHAVQVSSFSQSHANHMSCFALHYRQTYFDLSSGSTPTVGSSRMSSGGF